MSLQSQMDTDESWDIDGVDQVTLCVTAINMFEDDGLLKFVKYQVEIFLGELVTRKYSKCTFIDQHSDKVL